MDTRQSRSSAGRTRPGVARAPRAVLLLGTVAALVAVAVVSHGCVRAPPAVLACGAADSRLVSQTLVVSRWEHDEVTPEARARGLDLDGVVSDGSGPRCTDDYDFVGWTTGQLGVDNQFAAFVLGLLGGRFDAAGATGAASTVLARGELLWGFEVVVDEMDVTRSTVSLLRLEAIDSIVLSRERALAAGQRFRIVARTTSSIRCDLTGLHAAFASDLTLPLGDDLGPLPLTEPIVWLGVDADGTVRSGELGARITVEAGLAWAMGFVPIDETTVRAVAHPDLDPDSSGECQSISLGVGMSLVPAVLVD